jgi:hypothetical protein
MSTETFPNRRKREVPDGWYFERIIVEHKLMGEVGRDAQALVPSLEVGDEALSFLRPSVVSVLGGLYPALGGG